MRLRKISGCKDGNNKNCLFNIIPGYYAGNKKMLFVRLIWDFVSGHDYQSLLAVIKQYGEKTIVNEINIEECMFNHENKKFEQIMYTSILHEYKYKTQADTECKTFNIYFDANYIDLTGVERIVKILAEEN